MLDAGPQDNVSRDMHIAQECNGRLNLGKIRTNTRHFCRDHQIRIFYQFFLLFNFSIHSCSPVLKLKRTVSVKIRFQVWGSGSDIFITKKRSHVFTLSTTLWPLTPQDLTEDFFFPVTLHFIVFQHREFHVTLWQELWELFVRV